MRCSNKDGPDVPPPSRPCLVQENGYVYARGQAFSSFGNKAFTASTTAMTFVPGPVRPAGEFRVLRRPAPHAAGQSESRALAAYGLAIDDIPHRPHQPVHRSASREFRPREAGLNDQPQRSVRDARELQESDRGLKERCRGPAFGRRDRRGGAERSAPRPQSGTTILPFSLKPSAAMRCRP